MKQRQGSHTMIIEPAQSRIYNDECPSCGLPKSSWNRRTDWRCCSKKCTEKFEEFCIVRCWSDLRWKAFVRDNFICQMCWKKFKDSELIGDHIHPIALGGDEWDLDNVQTLCILCNKLKTRADHAKIGGKRRQLKILEEAAKNRRITDFMDLF